MKINTKLTKSNFTEKDNTNRILYIVIHFVGGVSTAKNNADHFYNKYVGASAHYFVDENEIWQVVDDGDIAWHVGAASYKHPYCRNTNSLGIELCCKKDGGGNWYFEDKTVQNAIQLTKSLMQKYSVPIENVLRHYDVTGKNCPEPFVADPAAWEAFKAKLVEDNRPLDQKYSIEDCTQQLNWDGIISDIVLWADKAYADTDIAWLLLKFYDYRLKNGGSVKLPLSVGSAENAVNILNKQGIISDTAKWMGKAADDDIKWLLVKLADYIN